MLASALFVMLSVGVYGLVDGWVANKEISQYVLGTSSNITIAGETSISGLLQTIWCRLRYGTKCDQMRNQQQSGISEDNIPVEQVLEREIRNLENEIKTDRGADQSSSYWSM